MNICLQTLAFLFLAASATAQCPPVLLNCPAVPQMICDQTTNDNLFWNESYWYDTEYETHDLSEGAADLSLTIVSNCPTGSISVRYVLQLDLDANGTPETLVDSDQLPDWNTVFFNNANGAGTARKFDERPVTPELKYGFALQTGTNGDTLIAQVRWNTEQTPGKMIVPQLPLGGSHRIVWTVTQGNETSTCAWDFTLKDCAKPTVFCINGLSVNIMPTLFISLWDTDFLQFTEDNITPVNQLETAIRRSGTGSGFPVNPDGIPQKYVQFDCDDLGTQLVEIWSRDKAGNADFCETYVIVQDNLSNCQALGSIPIACISHHCDDQPMDEVTVDLLGGNPALPPISFPPYQSQTSSDGCWSPAGLPLPLGYFVEPGKDNDPLNGVSTFDLILINKHILGLEPLNSPYKLIAADANGSRSVTTFDIIELRKLILGVYTELPNNTSWRFVPRDYVFPNPSNPFQQQTPYSTEITSSTVFPIEFYGIKIGDINCNAVAHSAIQPPEDRATSALALPNAYLAAGQMLETKLRLPAGVDWQGMQFALEFDVEKIDLEAVIPAALPELDEDAFAQPAPGMFTLSWFNTESQQLPAGTPILTLRWRAKTDLRLADVVRLAPKQLPPEAYTVAEEIETLQLLFAESAGTESSMVFNPQPNPTAGSTAIPVQVFSATSVALELFDLNGRLVFQQKNNLSAGLHRLEIPASALLKTGVYVWRVQLGDSVYTGRLVHSQE